MQSNFHTPGVKETASSESPDINENKENEEFIENDEN